MRPRRGRVGALARLGRRVRRTPRTGHEMDTHRNALKNPRSTRTQSAPEAPHQTTPEAKRSTTAAQRARLRERGGERARRTAATTRETPPRKTKTRRDARIRHRDRPHAQPQRGRGRGSGGRGGGSRGGEETTRGNEVKGLSIPGPDVARRPRAPRYLPLGFGSPPSPPRISTRPHPLELRPSLRFGSRAAGGACVGACVGALSLRLSAPLSRRSPLSPDAAAGSRRRWVNGFGGATAAQEAAIRMLRAP